MKIISRALLIIGVSVFSNITFVHAKDNPWEVSLPFERGVIHYKISGAQKGTETLYIRDHGNERVKITKSKGKVMFVTTETDTIEITTRDAVINIDRTNNTGTRMTNPQKLLKEEITKLSEKERQIVLKNFEVIGMNLATQMGGEVKLNAGEHLGYPCDLVTVMGSTSCQMSGTPIMLRMESNIMGVSIKTVAKKIEKNVKVSNDVFQVPEGVTVSYSKEADDMNRQMIASMIENMKDPNAAKEFQESMTQGRQQMEEAQRQSNQEQSQQVERDQDTDIDQGANGRNEDGEKDEKELNEMMQKGMKALEGLFK